MDDYKDFLTISRQVIVAFIPEKKRSSQLVNFFLEQATDYQILSILIENKIPFKYDSGNEKKLLTELYSQISSGVTYLNEQDKFEKAKSVALAVPTAPLTVPAVELLKSIGSVAGASYVAAKLGTLGIGSGAASAASGIGALVLASLLVYAAWKTYQRYFSRAARHCKGLKSKTRTKCIIKYKLEGRRRQHDDLVASKSACSKSKTPVKCHRVMDEKIAAVNKKIGKLREKLEAISHK
jgi:hypothetical protein